MYIRSSLFLESKNGMVQIFDTQMDLAFFLYQELHGPYYPVFNTNFIIKRILTIENTNDGGIKYTISTIDGEYITDYTMRFINNGG